MENTFSNYDEYLNIDGNLSTSEKLIAISRLQRAIIEGLSNIYLAMYVINFDDDSFLKIYAVDFIDKAMSRYTNAHDAINLLVTKMILSKFREEAEEFFDLSTLQQRLLEENAVSFDYIGEKLGWCRGHFIPISYHEDGTVKETMYMSQLIHDEKMEEEHLRGMAELDSFTKLYNRATGQKLVDKMIKSGRGGMFCLMDVDEFKQINDTHGHAVGDEVLVGVSNCLRESFRKDDILIRLGGDEFVVYGPYISDDKRAKECISRFKKNLARLKFDSYKEEVHVSIGYVVCKEYEYESFDNVYRIADDRMYNAKVAKKEKKANQENDALLNIIAGDPSNDVNKADIEGAVLIYRADESEEILYASAGVLNLYECKTLTQFFEYTNKSFRGMVHPEDLERVESEIEKQIELNKDMKIDYVEYRIITAEGNVAEVKDFGHLIETPSYGKAFYVVLGKK